jgi:outer membrane scaffolding protein for murein synthesis (MipA/OmpV family)
VGSLEARRLRGDAARSPLDERNSSHFVTAGLAYKF